jgi:hypothetical protein
MKRSFWSLALASALAGTTLLTSCSNEEELAPNPENAISQATLAKFENLGFNPNDIVRQGENFLVGGDIVVTPEAFAEMVNAKPISVPGVADAEQYRTWNLVSSPRTIRVRASGLNSKASTALDWAIANFNRLNTGLTWRRVSSGGDIVVRQSGSSAGGVAGFPSGGRPYNSVTLYGGTTNYDTNVVEHVLTHELGHCIGLRHSDYFNRSYSCSSGGNEGSGGVGAVHIPGTPTGYDSQSLMNACFSASEDGEFSYYDRVAIEYLY